ncbi:TIGR00341 family protein [uncultured Flavobacterium sp.]|uniref:TIGR00341 family protein n=1 Tax=uncultured Flavobacterium sp. TaxID=165435 RepID=UPI0030EBEF65|tara:strand:+ start:261447 stop:262745 length:1299 start_codon:yes stop_codon:yes gene_type:complete
MNNILDNFKLNREKENFKDVIESINNGVDFQGTNLWVLVFAIFIASLGLNINSPAVVIGAMLISPLMGPIMGLGLGMAINDLTLLKKAGYNYLFAAAVGLVTSTLYFAISPINDAQTEILARTSPTIYDVLIAFVGGLAGILATSSKLKGNVIPGVAIATALMPPLCTAGYGLATLRWEYFLGAFYLFLINTVFIALATLITARLLKFPFKVHPDEKEKARVNRVVWIIVIITLIPSIYFGYDIVQKNKFEKKANEFVNNEANFPDNYLLKKTINPKSKEIVLTYGGLLIKDSAVNVLRAKLNKYYLQDCNLKIQQGFSYLNESNNNDEEKLLTNAISEKSILIENLSNQLDSIHKQKTLTTQIYKELKAQYPTIENFVLQPSILVNDSIQKNIWISNLKSKEKINSKEKKQMKEWLKVRLDTDEIIMNFEN